MSNLADTSRAALERVDRTAGQNRVLAVFEKWTNITRHEIAAKSGLPLQSVCGRVNELLKAGALTELDATRDGRHLLKINERRVDSACQASAPSPTVQGADCENDGANPSPLTLHAVKPVFEHHRMSMTQEQAERLLAHPKANTCDQYKEAMRVKTSGMYYVEI